MQQALRPTFHPSNRVEVARIGVMPTKAKRLSLAVQGTSDLPLLLRALGNAELWWLVMAQNQSSEKGLSRSID